MSVPAQTGGARVRDPGASSAPDDARATGLRLARLLAWATHAVVTVAIVVLVMAFFLQLFNASTAAKFTQWVYRAAERVMQPYRGIFSPVLLGGRGSVLDLAMLFAILAYGVFAEAVGTLVSWLERVTVEHRAVLRHARAVERREEYAQSLRDAEERALAARRVRTSTTTSTTMRQGPGTV